ncbi:MAG TPA: hypothetical protein VI583_05600 [Cyclobacteriaceae bacterium]|nr:hypothetical protein [Cyclobacteriaceae bacterium]
MFKFVVILKLKTVRILPFVVYALLGCLQGLAQVVSGGDLGMARDQYERGKYYEAIELLNHTLKADSAND